MVHTVDRGTRVIYTNDIAVFQNTAISCFVLNKTAVYGILAATILRSMIGLYCKKTYNAMTKYDNGDDNKDNDGNKDVNNDDNAAAVSGYDGLIFDLTTKPW